MDIVVEENDKKTIDKKHEYYATFKARHQTKLKEKIICPICEGSYTYYNKSTHNKTKKHILISKIKNNSTNSTN